MRRLRDITVVLAVAAVLPLAGLAGSASGAGVAGAQEDPPPVCAPGGEIVELDGAVAPEQAKTYLLLPFEVAAGTTRVEVGYAWADEGVRGSPPPPSTPLTQTVFDLGLWDNDGYRSVDGFRGWSGSRQGRLHDGQDRIWVQPDAADRAFGAGPIEPGIWHVELGVAAVGPGGATWRVEIACFDPPVGGPPAPDPVDATHVARAEPGWYHGDFHIHAFHSAANAPTWDEFAGYVRDAGLDFAPITEYVVAWHWDEIGAVQRANPDLLLWPGREIITYFGHANTLGETRNVIEYRHGFEDITLRDIQAAAVADGALFQVAHPTTFQGPLWENFCRGCEYTLDDQTDWAAVDTIEVLTGPIVVDPRELGGPETPRGMQNPFTQDAIDLWEDLLGQGHKITAVSGSDAKTGPLYGMNATAVHARELSRAALVDAVKAGHAYVRTRGVHDSPSLEMTAVTADGQEGIFGDTLYTDEAEVTVTVTGAANQLLRVVRDGQWADLRPIPDDEFTYTFTATRDDGSGPLGTFWRVETLDDVSLTTIGNPIFLAAGDPPAPPAPDAAPAPPAEPEPSRTLPATGGGLAVALALLATAGVCRLSTRSRRSPTP